MTVGPVRIAPAPPSARSALWKKREIVSTDFPDGATLSNLLKEDRRFEPPAEIAEYANLKEEAYDRAASDRDAFWAEQARLIDWQRPPQTICDYSRPPFVNWFAGGTTNLCHNAVDPPEGSARPERTDLRFE